MKPALRNLVGVFLATIVLPASGQVPPDEDPVKISPQYYTVRFENNQVRVLDYRLRPGETEAMHSHPAGVVHYLSDATFRTTLPDGSVSESSVKKGDIQWRDFTRHAAVNIGSTEALAFAIELKTSASEDAAN